MKRYAAEFLGTYALVFFGTGAIIVNEVFNGGLTHLGVSIVFGLVVMAMIYAFGHISGAHINPAATVTMALTRRMPPKDVTPYLAAQVLGALLASATLRVLFPLSVGLGATVPAGTATQSLLLEFLMTYFLMLTVLKSTEKESTSRFAGVVIGGLVLLEALFGGPVSGASMNPARSIGPALLTGNIHPLWIYLVGPFAGSIGAAETHKRI